MPENLHVEFICLFSCACLKSGHKGIKSIRETQTCFFLATVSSFPQVRVSAVHVNLWMEFLTVIDRVGVGG